MSIIIGYSGIWTVVSPFTLDSTSRRCSAINTFESLEVLSVSVLSQIYLSVGLTKEEYTADKVAGVRLITLESSLGVSVIIPEKYIDGIPVSEAMPYSYVVLGVEIGVLWDDVDLTAITESVRQQVSDHVGIATTAAVRRIPFKEVIDKEKHDQIETARQTNIVYGTSDKTNLAIANTKIADQATRIAFLEEIIANNYV